MILLIVSIVCFGLAVIPTFMFAVNLRFFTLPRKPAEGSTFELSLLIPARDEANNIRRAVESALKSQQVKLEVVVLDDHSTDATADIVRDMALHDSRVRLAASPRLPDGWCGKQYACWQLAQMATYDLMVFMDADVELAPETLAMLAAELSEGRSGLISLFPRQVTVGWTEQLVIPLMHVVLLGFLPMWQMRCSKKPSLAAGCGQLFAARRDDYFNAGGHQAIKSSRHDGITLPRAFRRQGIWTDVFDGTQLTSCRMYSSAPQLLAGLAKNATEGLASPQLIVPASAILLGGQVLPAVVWIAALFTAHVAASIWAGTALLMTIAVRLIAAVTFDQSIPSAMLNPVGVTILVGIQWYAAARRLCGKPIAWRGRYG